MAARLVLALALCHLSLPASAAFLYSITYDVQAVTDNVGQPISDAARDFCANEWTDPSFPCDLDVGDEFYGYFETDVELESLADGNRLVSINRWFTQYGSVIWDSESPAPDSAFDRFLSPEVDFWPDNVPWSDDTGSMGFIIQDGIIASIYGGVYGDDEPPWIDFFGGSLEESDVVGFGPNSFSAFDRLFFAKGQVTIEQVVPIPAPASLALVLLAMGAIRVARPKRRSWRT